jgi:glyoxylase-like metal-dependent hydrolase (beta-lactamase superfamily II)
MPLAIHPLNLGEMELDYSFFVWGTNQGMPMRIPTTCWLITGAEKPILVDSSFRTPEAITEAAGIPAWRSPEQTLEAQLARHQLTPADIGYLIHTHLHHDHTGLDDQVPNARILLQRAELQYAAAPLFPHPFFDRVDITKLVGPLWNRIELLDGERELFPGIRAVVTGGHSPAHQMLYVEVPSGTAIIAGDAAYIAEMNVGKQVPMGYFVNLSEVMAALGRLSREGKHILPSHDPAIYQLYPDGIR